MSWLGIEAGWLIAIVAIVAAIILAGAVLLFNIQRYVITIITCIGGANGIVAGVLLIFQRVTPGELTGAGNMISPVLADSWFWLLAWLALFAAGLVYQLRVNREFVFSYERYQEGWG